MADNFVAQAVTSAGSTFAAQEISGVLYSVGKLSFGSTNVTTVASTDAGVPVQLAVNGLIPGSSAAGMTGGAGAVAANTPRVTHASNDPAVTALEIIDDWDETDRCKVNIVAGQVGISASSGAVAANTPRITLASDDPAVVALQIMDDWDETDRAKVNIIAGQVGVAGGTGVDAANVQRVTLATDIGLPAGTNIIGTVQVSSITPGTGASALGKQTGTAGSTAGVGVLAQTLRFDTAATIADTTMDHQPLITDGSGRLWVNAGVVASHEVTNAGTFAVQAAQSGTWNVGTVTGGAVAHDSTDAGNPLKVGSIALSTDRAAVAALDRSDLIADVNGKLVVRGHCLGPMQIDGNATATTTDHTSLIAAQGVAATLNITNVSFANSSTTPTICIIASSTTIKWYTVAPAQSGSNLKFDPPLRMAANAACQFRVLSAVSTVYAAASGYVAST